MVDLQFLFGKNLSSSTPFTPGTIFLDTETKEIWFDDPASEVTEHKKVIDKNTLLYWIESTIMADGTEVEGTTPPPVGNIGSTTARLGYGVLGTMVLGNT